MITNQEISATQLSYTKKDFYQIYTELLDTARKISERWDPTSTNETDPGIVLLKVLTAVADKINYNIDKNILEAFMPSASQEESMRKLCEMMGYDIKYYQSAVTTVSTNISKSYFETEDASSSQLFFPIFSTLKDANDEITYTTLKSFVLNKDVNSAQGIPVIEGVIEDCKNGNNTAITIENIDDNNRYYLPETQIAENGIFIVYWQKEMANVWNSLDGTDNYSWKKVSNLNTQPTGTPCWKFGFDSRKGLPYIQFPEDINAIINNGICIKYIRTNGVNGNISANTLTKFDSVINIDEDTLSKVAVRNASAAKNGANIETINQAYKNYKKTIGTFDTLVTCRDYMNKIYQLLDETNQPLVSNVIVSDIRDDINRSYVLTTFDEYGLTRKSLQAGDKLNDNIKLSNFDLMLYPFAPYKGLNTTSDYNNSFRYTTSNMHNIAANLEDQKTIAHNLRNPEVGEICCIKNYLKLNAKITTTKKVNSIEEAEILENVKSKLYENFNMRQLDFGEEIPYDSILDCIEQADRRIKNVVLDEPETDIRFSFVGDEQEHYASNTEDPKSVAASNRLLVRNILAGRVPMFDYDTNFVADYAESGCTTYPDNGKKIESLEPKFDLNMSEYTSKFYKLQANEVVQLQAPNFRTTTTYPAYVRYFLHLKSKDFISKDTEYKLKDGEYLYTMYKPAASTDESGTQQESKTFITDKHTNCIIRPNFMMYDSDTWHTDHKWPITKDSEGGIPTELSGKGMFLLGQSEQVEMRDKVIINLDGAISYIYWDVNDVIQDNDYIEINYVDNKYMLKENEHFYYTDSLKSDFVEFGSGTLIEKPAGLSTKRLQRDTIAYDKIAEYGLDAINWLRVNLTKDSPITLHEYQYITLTAGDSVMKSGGDKYTYKINDGNETATPTFENIGDDAKWELKTLLSLNCGPDLAQPLGENDSVTVHYKDSTSDTVIKGAALNKTTNQQVAIKTNYPLNTTSVLVQYKGTPEFEENDDDELEIKDWTYDGKIKQFNLSTQPISQASSLENYLSFGITSNKTELSISIEPDKLGLLMVYCADAGVLIEANKANCIRKYGTDGQLAKSINLEKGMNIVEFNHLTGGQHATVFSLKLSSASSTDMVPVTIDKHMSIINGIPLDRLGFIGNESELLNLINAMTGKDKFYYNCPIQNSVAMNITAFTEEKPTSPKLYFDSNNVNSKFVISQLDTKSLKNITLTRQSKL